MVSKDFKLPDLGEGVHEGQVLRVMVKPGDQVREDQPLMEVETDKAAVVIPCPYTGVVEQVHVVDGQMVHVGDVMVTIAPPQSARPESPAGASASTGANVVTSSSSRTSTAAPTDSGTLTLTAKPQTAALPRKPASPAVRKLARTLNVDIETIQGTGPGGRIQRVDVERAAAALAAPPPAPLPSPGPMVSRPAQLARAAAPKAVAYAPLPESPIVEPPGEDSSDQYGPIKLAPLTQARKTIASVMAQSWSTIPHATDFDDADVTELEKLRKGYTSPDDPSRKLTMLAFVIRAVVRALQRFPEFNASIDIENNQIIYRRYINIAVGVHTDRGLVPMVLRNADRMSIPQISDELAILSEKARTASFVVNDTRGGTYTISNAGAMGGSRYSTPIITPPQVAVLALGRTKWMPWVVDGQVVPRLIMPLSHSIDHRLLDGGQEVQFMQHIIGDLQNPARLLL